MSFAIEEQTNTVAFMNEIFSYLNSSDTTYSLLNSIHHSLKSVIYAENFFVVLLSSSKRYVTFPFYKDVKDALSAESLNEVPLEDIFSTLTFYAIKKRKVVSLTRTEINKLLDSNEVKIIGSIPEQWICFPLQHKGVYFGNFVVQSYRACDEYSDRDIDILSYISRVIATALFLFNKNLELQEALSELGSYKDQLEVKIHQRTAQLEDTLSSLQDEIDKSKALQQQLTFEVFHDNLTKLYNRKYLVEQLEVEASKVARKKSSVSLAYMDLDGFKGINDSYGHECGDIVLEVIAERLKSCFRRHDIIARFGGDEFVTLFINEITLDDLTKLFNRLIMSISQPINYKNEQVSVGISIGVATSDESEIIQTKLLAQADKALYQAKNSGKGCFEIYQLTSKAVTKEDLVE